jgi:hypothetical protein
MKKLILLLFIACSLQVFSQPWTNLSKYKPGLWLYGFKVDSTLVIPSDTTRNKLTGSIAVKNNLFLFKDANGWRTLLTSGILSSYLQKSDSTANSGYATQYDISLKVDKEPGKGLSTNDYTDVDSVKLKTLGEVNGIIKSDGTGNISQAVSVTDYMPAWDLKLWNEAYNSNHTYVIGDMMYMDMTTSIEYYICKIGHNTAITGYVPSNWIKVSIVPVIVETDPVAGAVTGIVKSDGNGGITNAESGVDYEIPNAVNTTSNTYADGKVADAINDGTTTVAPSQNAVFDALTGKEPANTNIQSHISSTSNPHSVTKTQVGLQYVDNTSDANKPVSTAQQAALDLKINTSLKGTAGGIAELDGTGKVPAAQLPSFVDDVLEYTDFISLPVTGEGGKIYVTLDDYKTYRWSGTVYAEISSSLALGETSTTAYRGDRGKVAYDHSQSAHNYEPAISKSTGFLKWNGSGWVWDSSSYLTSFTETDPTIYAWAKATTKPSYTYSEVGADASGTATTVVGSHESTYNHSNYNTAYTDRLKWDGEAGAWFNAATARTSLGLVIGTDVLAYRTFGSAANSSTTDFAAADATIFKYNGGGAVDLNTLLSNGTYSIFEGASNIPTGSTSYGSVLKFGNTYPVQLYADYDGSSLFYRTNNATVFTSWKKVWHDGNLNLSTVPFTASTISTASHGTSSNWKSAYDYSLIGHLPLTGGTLTGFLAINSSTTGLRLVRPSTSQYTGVSLQTGEGNEKWFVGLRENLTSDNYIIYNSSTGHDALTIGTNDAATFYGNAYVGGSGTFTGAVLPSVAGSYDLGAYAKDWALVHARQYVSDTGTSTFNNSVSISGNLTATGSGTFTGAVSSSVAGDNFPHLYLERSSASTYTNRKWDFGIGTDGRLGFDDVTAGATRFSINTAGLASFFAGVAITGNLTTTGTATATGNMYAPDFVRTSDSTLKRNIKPIQKKFDFKFYQYSLKSDSTNRLQYGVIAQEIEKDYPEFVYTDPNGKKGVAYTGLLIAKVAQMDKEINEFKSERYLYLGIMAFMLLIFIVKTRKRNEK